MAGPIVDENDEKPLDPAVEKVRRKLVRFVAINLGLLFAAVMAVLAAVVYKSTTNEAPVAAADSNILVPSGEALAADIPIPAGARIVAHALSGNRISLDLELAGSRRVILVYDMSERRVVAELAVTPQ